MSKKKGWAKVLHAVGIVFMGITAIFTIMAGAGTSCVAFAAEKFGPNMAPIAPYSWLYILFVILTTAIGVMMVRAVVLLIKKKANAYRYTIISLLLGIGIGVIHMIASRALRGKSMPTDGVVYFTLLTLILFLIFKIPAIWKEMRFGQSDIDDTNKTAAAITLALTGIAVLTAPLWGAATHTFIPGGMNWANAWPLQMSLIGSLLILSGVSLAAYTPLKMLVRSVRKSLSEQPEQG